MNEIVLKVSGMMCQGCENRVQNVVSQIENVESVKANHQEGKVTIKTKGEVDIKQIKNTIEELDYKVEE